MRREADRSFIKMFMCDPDAKFSKSIGWTQGPRLARYAMVIDHGKVVYAEKEQSGGEVTVSRSSSQTGGWSSP